MKSRENWFLKNIHLLISTVIVIPTGIIYGSPSVLPDHLDIEVKTIDLANMLKAIMFLYLGIAVIWILGMCKPKYWTAATQLNLLFMMALAMGRSLSVSLDGIPSDGYLYGMIGEYILGFYSLYQLRKYDT